MSQSLRPLSVSETLAPPKPALGLAQRVLVIEAHDALAALTPVPRGPSVVLTQKRMLSRQMVETVRPDAVIGPLITAEWDIVDLAMTLESLGFTGVLYAITRPLPRAELVVREVAAVCPGLTVELLEIA